MKNLIGPKEFTGCGITLLNFLRGEPIRFRLRMRALLYNLTIKINVQVALCIAVTVFASLLKPTRSLSEVRGPFRSIGDSDMVYFF